MRIRALKVLSMKHPVMVTLDTSIESFKAIVSEGADEILNVASMKLSNDVYIIYAPMAHLAGCEANRKVNGEIISGTFIIVGVDEHTLPISLTDEQVLEYYKRFRIPERYSYSEVIDAWIRNLEKEIDEMAV